jgi:hypothetical protein
LLSFSDLYNRIWNFLSAFEGLGYIHLWPFTGNQTSFAEDAVFFEEN